MAIFCLLLACLAQVGCGREQPPEPAPRRSGQSSPPVSDPRPLIVAFGDSLLAGFGLDPGSSYPDFLQRELDRRGYRYRVVNAGVSGETTTDGLARVGTVIAQHPAIVILELGANDGLRGLPVAATKANLEQIIAELNKAGTKILLAGMTLPPNYGPAYIHAFERIYPELAAKHQTGLIPFLLAGVGGTRFMQRDGLHPTVEGNRRVAASVMQALEPMLR